MDVHIGKIDSTIRATDTQALLSPQMLEQIVSAVLERLREEQQHEQRVADERRLRAGVLASHPQDWR